MLIRNILIATLLGVNIVEAATAYGASGESSFKRGMENMRRKGKQDQAITDFEQARASGYAAASTALGVMYFEGLGVDQDMQKANDFFNEAIPKRDCWAAEQIGKMYFRGQGKPVDYGQARGLFEQAINWCPKKPPADALFKLGEMYCKGLGVDKDARKAKELWQRAAILGHEYAKTVLNNGGLEC